MSIEKELRDQYRLARARLNRGIPPAEPEPEPEPTVDIEIVMAFVRGLTIPKRGKDIIDQVATKYGIAAREIIGPWRPRHITKARHEAMYRCRTELFMSYPKIGAIFGGRDHTSVLHGVVKHALVNDLEVPGRCTYYRHKVIQRQKGLKDGQSI